MKENDNMRESSQKLYEIMFNPNLMAMQKYEAIRTLLEDMYQCGYCDGMKDSDLIYFELFANEEFNDFSIEEW